MKYGKVLLVVVLGASLALGGVASPSQGATLKTPSKKPVKAQPVAVYRHDPGRARPQPRCSYPPVRTPALWMGSWSNEVWPGETFRLSGTLKVNNCGVPQTDIGVFASDSPDGPYDDFVGSNRTNNNGEYSIYITESSPRYYRAASVATNSYDAAMSNRVFVPLKHRRHHR